MKINYFHYLFIELNFWRNIANLLNLRLFVNIHKKKEKKIKNLKLKLVFIVDW